MMVHNYYQQPGGEDQVFREEVELLEQRGHNVHKIIFHNDSINKLSALGKVNLAVKTIFNLSTYKEFRAILHEIRPDIIHFHNTFPLVSPSAYYAAKAEGVPVVQTLHNYRLMCANSTLFRNNRVCEDCIHNKYMISSLMHGCYKESKLGTMTVTGMLLTNRMLGSYNRMVDTYIALTEFAKSKYIEGGLPQNKIEIKPNFLFQDPLPGDGNGGFFLFVGRLTVEKGILTLLDTWAKNDIKVPLKIIGDGPLAEAVASASDKNSFIHYLGRRPMEDVFDLMGQSSALIFPSLWYEGLPKTIIEAYAKGTPVIASKIGAMESLIKHGETGYHFEPGNIDELANLIHSVSNNEAMLKLKRQTARQEFEQHYTSDMNYAMLMNIYKRAQQKSQNRQRIKAGGF